MNSIWRSALFNSLATVFYIVLIGLFFYYAGSNKLGQNHAILIPIFMLMLFVFSATLTGSLIIGKPVLWYLEGKKKEAFTLLAYTLGIFFFVILLAFILLLIFSR